MKLNPSMTTSVAFGVVGEVGSVQVGQCNGASGSEHSILLRQQTTPGEEYDLTMVAWLQLDTYLLMKRERITMADAGSVVWLQPLGSVGATRARKR